MFRAQHFKKKEVIDIETAQRIGYVSDVEIGERTGNIEAIIVPKTSGIFSFFINSEIVIPWDMIEVVGEDVILVHTRKVIG